MYNRKGLAKLRGIIPRGRQSGRQALLEVLRAWSRYLHKGLHPVSLRSQWWGEGLPVRWRDAHYLSVWGWRLTHMHAHTHTQTWGDNKCMPWEQWVSTEHGTSSPWCDASGGRVRTGLEVWRLQTACGLPLKENCSQAVERQYYVCYSPPASFIFHV